MLNISMTQATKPLPLLSIALSGYLLSGCGPLLAVLPKNTYYAYSSGEVAELFDDPSTPLSRREELWQKNLAGLESSGTTMSWRVGRSQTWIRKNDGPPLRVLPSPDPTYDERWEYPLWYFDFKRGRLRHVELTHKGQPPEILQTYSVVDK